MVFLIICQKSTGRTHKTRERVFILQFLHHLTENATLVGGLKIWGKWPINFLVLKTRNEKNINSRLDMRMVPWQIKLNFTCWGEERDTFVGSFYGGKWTKNLLGKGLRDLTEVTLFVFPFLPPPPHTNIQVSPRKIFILKSRFSQEKMPRFYFISSFLYFSVLLTRLPAVHW